MAYKRPRKAFEEDIQRHESPFVVYGTPLPPLHDAARDDGSFVPVWKQEVTDDRGRKRLHGAFTGGFSAGYFNTVGSKEGWTPSTFVSSRGNRAKDQKTKVESKPEDFMDDEDIREQEESRQLSTIDGFAGFGTEDDPMHRNTLMELFQPAENSMGAKLLNRMGWKQGQGIGPRVRRKVEGDEDSTEMHLFAPEDVSMISFVKKNDFKGLGSGATAGHTMPSSEQHKKPPAYQSDDEDDSRPGLNFMAQSKKASRSNKTGFGVGILNDTGSDEEDPYSMGPKISYSKTLGSDKKPKKKTVSKFGTANPLLKNKPTFVPKKLASLQHTLRKCHDGRLPLAGFVLADELDAFSDMSLTGEKYKPPEVPPDWKPAKLPNDTQDSTDDQSTKIYESTADTARHNKHSSATRAALLGEQRLPGKSIFDFVTPEARAKLAKATGKTNLPPALSERLPNTDSNMDLDIDLPQLDTATAKSALSRAESGGFMPYAEDPEKRTRYKKFLEYSAGLSESSLPARPPHASREDILNEIHEFIRAAEVFRPMTGAIASRFTSSTSDSPDTPSNTESLMRKPQAKPEDPAEVAAKLGMFGIMTRSSISFQPNRMVCKRFGVDMPVAMPMSTYAANPAANMHDLPTKTLHQGTSTAPSDSVKLAGYVTGKTSDQPEIAAAGTHSSSHMVDTIDPDKNEALEQERPGQAVFKAIFGDSDSDDDE